MNEIDKLMNDIINNKEEEVEENIFVPVLEPKEVETPEIKEEPKEEIMKVSSELKQNWTFMYSRFLSEDGLPDDFSHLGIFLISFLGDEDLANRFYKELDKLEADDHNPYTKKMILDAIYARSKAYHECNFIARQIRELDKRFDITSKDAKDGDKKVYTALRNELRRILKEVNINLPIINDCLLIAVSLALKFTELQYRVAPREMIYGKSNYGEMNKSLGFRGSINDN